MRHSAIVCDWIHDYCNNLQWEGLFEEAVPSPEEQDEVHRLLKVFNSWYTPVNKIE